MMNNKEIREKIEKEEWKITQDEMCIIDTIVLENLIKDVKRKYGMGFSKSYRQMPEGEFANVVIEEMERWMFLKKVDESRMIKICPLVGKIQGSYPKDYAGGNEHE